MAGSNRWVMCKMAWLDRIFSRGTNERRLVRQRLRLETLPQVTYVVGDIHGHSMLYRKLEARIAAEAAALDQRILIVSLGDLVDRGPDTAGVLDYLTARAPAGVQRQILIGNHEEKMLAFFDAPGANKDWLGWGGFETLMSYGMTPDANRGFDLPERQLRHMLAAHIPDDHIRFLRALPVSLRMGPYFLCHAGIDPSKPLDDQTERDLMWTRGMVGDPPEDAIVIHGHTPVDHVATDGRYINVDTGAYASGRLSALRIARDEPLEVVEVS